MSPTSSNPESAVPILRRVKVEVSLTEHTNADTYGGKTIVEAKTSINLPVPGGPDAIVDLIHGQVRAMLDAAVDLPLTTAVLADPVSGSADAFPDSLEV